MPTILLLISLIAAAVAPAAELPNFILILTDDQGWGDLGAYGSPYIRTPNIDRMAAEGVRFTDFYAQPFCGPSRAALMTGTYPARNSLMFNHLPRAKTGIHPDEITIAELLKQKDYATKIIGKWHLGDAPQFLPTRNGFDEYFGFPYSNDMWPFHPKIQPTAGEPELRKKIRKRAEYTDYSGRGQIYPLDWFPALPLIEGVETIELNPDQSKITERYTNQALEFIERNREKPFFLYLAEAMPHVPLFAGAKFEGQSRRGLYGDVIEEIDASVGRILKKLKEAGIDDRTLVVFTSDNGPWLDYGIDSGSAGPLRDGKGTTFEGGVRVPAIFRMPGRIPAGKVTSGIAANLDLFPTFAHLAGINLPSDRVIDGVNLWPLLTHPETDSPRDSYFYFEGGLNYRAEDGPPKNDPRLKAIRQGQWKLHVETVGDEARVVSGDLYDLQADIGEKRSVAVFHPDIVERLRNQAQRFNDDVRRNTRPLGRL